MKLKRTKAFVKVKELLTYKRIIEQEKERYLTLVEEHEATTRYLKKVEILLEKERAASCYFHDCKEVLLGYMYNNMNKSPIAKQMLDKFREFNKYAIAHYNEKYDKIRKEEMKGGAV